MLCLKYIRISKIPYQLSEQDDVIQNGLRYKVKSHGTSRVKLYRGTSLKHILWKKNLTKGTP